MPNGSSEVCSTVRRGLTPYYECLRQLEVRRLGLIGYDEALALQRELVEERRAEPCS